MNPRRARALPVFHSRRRLFGPRLPGLVGVALAAGTIALAASPVLATRGPGASSPTTVIVEKTSSWGPVLALSSGWTVYRLTSDPMDKSTCTGECAKYWPPVGLALVVTLLGAGRLSLDAWTGKILTKRATRPLGPLPADSP
jgi:uncharacterized membrane protein YphA (DoxX/SURF4 family)